MDTITISSMLRALRGALKRGRWHETAKATQMAETALSLSRGTAVTVTEPGGTVVVVRVVECSATQLEAQARLLDNTLIACSSAVQPYQLRPQLQRGPKPKADSRTENISIMVSPKMRSWLNRRASRAGKPLSTVVVDILDDVMGGVARSSELLEAADDGITVVRERPDDGAE